MLLSPVCHSRAGRATESLLDVEIRLGGGGGGLSHVFVLLSPMHSLCGDEGR
jgi:hypothetical protein